ncbi:MAG: hypothetical protein ACPF8V_01230, partial [Luteibaculum sp.]
GVNLGGYKLSTVVNGQLIETQLSNQLTLFPNGFMVLWLDSLPQLAPNHLNFGLNSNGGSLILRGPFGTVLSEVNYRPGTENKSQGFAKDCGENFGEIENATPGESNEVTGIQENSAAISPSIWPNPSSNFIHRSEKYSKERWILLDTKGRLVMEWPIGKSSISVESLEPAVYLVKSAKNEFIGKLVR